MTPKRQQELLNEQAMADHLRTPRSLRIATRVGDRIRVELVTGFDLQKEITWFDFEGGLSEPVERKFCRNDSGMTIDGRRLFCGLLLGHPGSDPDQHIYTAEKQEEMQMSNETSEFYSEPQHKLPIISAAQASQLLDGFRISTPDGDFEIVRVSER